MWWEKEEKGKGEGMDWSRIYTMRYSGELLDPVKICGFHGGDYEECCLLGCCAVWLLWEPTFRRFLALPSSGWEGSVNWELR
jgi:hypothetical protein